MDRNAIHEAMRPHWSSCWPPDPEWALGSPPCYRRPPLATETGQATDTLTQAWLLKWG